MTGIKDLAKHLNISIGTVSRALNNRQDVSPKTRASVLKAAKELGYQANQAGRALRQGTSNVVGFVLTTDSQEMVHGDLFFVRVFDGMQSVLSQYNLDLVALLSSANNNPAEYLERVVARRLVDAIVLSATKRHDPRIDFLAERNIPFVTLGRSLTDGGQPWLDLDFAGMVENAIQRLASKNHTRIAIALLKGELNLGYVMLETYQKALHQQQLPYDPQLVITIERGEAGAINLAHDLMSIPNPPTAIIFCDHLIPFGLYRGLAEMGLTPGKDLAVIGVGTRLASLLSPSLTYYKFNLFALGQSIAQALLSTIPQHAAQHPQIIRQCVPFSIIEGESDANALPKYQP